MPATIELSLCAMGIGIGVGLSVALFAALGTRPWLARLANGIGAIGLVVPIFWIGILLLVVGSLWLGWFPMGGRFDMAAIQPDRVTGLFLLDALLAGRFPGVCDGGAAFGFACGVFIGFSGGKCGVGDLLALAGAGVAGVYRGFAFAGVCSGSDLVEALVEDFDWADGYGDRNFLWGFVGRGVFDGDVFSWPGIGRYLVNAILARDVFVAQNLLTFFGVAGDPGGSGVGLDRVSFGS